jgi:hypothetical protein
LLEHDALALAAHREHRGGDAPRQLRDVEPGRTSKDLAPLEVSRDVGGGEKPLGHSADGIPVRWSPRNSLQNEDLCRPSRARTPPGYVLGRTRTLRRLRVRLLPASLPGGAQRAQAAKRHSATSSKSQPLCDFFAAARFSLRRSLSVFCGFFFCSFFGLSAPFTLPPGSGDRH